MLSSRDLFPQFISELRLRWPMYPAGFRARPLRMPSLLGPISSPVVSAERILVDSKGFEWGPESPDTCLQGESQFAHLYPEAPEQCPECQGKCLHWQGISSPSACHSSVVPARWGCSKKGLCGFLQWINLKYPPSNNGGRQSRGQAMRELQVELLILITCPH